MITYPVEKVRPWRQLLYAAPILFEPTRAYAYDVIGEYNRVSKGDRIMSQRTFLFPKDKLITEITENRNNHRAAFEAALGAYREEVIRVLEQQLAQAKKGERIPRGHGLTCPTDMTREYNQILAILDMTVEDEIELTQQEFACYVLDQWHWKTQFAQTASAYLCKFSNDDLSAGGERLLGQKKLFGRALDVDKD